MSVDLLDAQRSHAFYIMLSDAAPFMLAVIYSHMLCHADASCFVHALNFAKCINSSKPYSHYE